MATNKDSKWFVGEFPVSKAFAGETQVYPAGPSLDEGVIYSQEFINQPNVYGYLKAGEIKLETYRFWLLYNDAIDRSLLKLGMNARVWNLTLGTRHTYYNLRSYGSDTGVHYKYQFETGSTSFPYGQDQMRLDLYAVGQGPN